MATTKVNVTGPVVKPGTGTLTSGTVKFVLTGWDTDTGNDETIYHEAVTATIDGSGDFTAALWPNDRGSQATRYRVYVTGEAASGSFETLLGRISVPEAGAPHELSDLLAAGAPTVNAVYMGLITQEQYDAAIAVLNVTYVTLTTDHTLEAGNERKNLEADSASDLTLTIPADATHDFPIGTWFVFTRANSGGAILDAEDGVTLLNAYGLSIPAQEASFVVTKRDANIWRVTG